MKIRGLLLLVLVCLLAVVPALGLWAAPDQQEGEQVLRVRTRPIRVSRRAPNREAGVNNPGGLSSCRTSNSDVAVYFNDGTIYAEGFPGESWVLGIASPTNDLTEHITFWVLSDSFGTVFLEDAGDIQAAGADPRSTMLIGSNGQIRGLCLQPVFDSYGNRPISLYDEYASAYPVTDAEGMAPLPPPPDNVLKPEQSQGPSPFGTTTTGVIYAITDDYDLLWYRHYGWADGSQNWDAKGGIRVGNGWNFRAVFSD